VGETAHASAHAAPKRAASPSRHPISERPTGIPEALPAGMLTWGRLVRPAMPVRSTILRTASRIADRRASRAIGRIGEVGMQSILRPSRSPVWRQPGPRRMLHDTRIRPRPSNVGWTAPANWIARGDRYGSNQRHCQPSAAGMARSGSVESGQYKNISCLHPQGRLRIASLCV
jgi:hypothetical protein